MKTVKKPTKAHKSKKVVKAHQGFAADGSKATAEQSKPKQMRQDAEIDRLIGRGSQPSPAVGDNRGRRNPNQDTIRRLNNDRVKQIEGKRNPMNPMIKRNPNYSLPPGYMKEMDTQREINKRMRGNKVVADNEANIQRRADAELKRRGGRNQLQAEQLDYYLGGRKGKRPERVDPFKGMSSRERRRAQNATRSEFDETNRQVRKQMGTQRKPRQQRPFGGIQTPMIPQQYINPRVAAVGASPNIKDRVINKKPSQAYQYSSGPATTNMAFRNKGGVVKKKYTEVKTLKQGGYVSRAKYGSVDNLNKKK